MKILQLCKKFPFPLKDGEAIAVTNLSKSLRDLGCEITLLAMNTTKHYVRTDELPADFDHYEDIHTVDIDNRVNPLGAFTNLFSKQSYHISRFVSTDFKDKLIKLIKENDYDVIQLETLYLAPYVDIIKEHTDALVAMRAHNVEHEIWDRITQNERFFPKKMYLDLLTRKLKRFEMTNLNSYDFLIAITDRDLHKFKNMGYKNGAIASPIGINVSDYISNAASFKKRLSLSFIGSLDWVPNREGLQWFLENVWDDVQNDLPDLILHVAGRNTPEDISNLKKPNLFIHGEIPDAPAFISDHSVMIVPLFAGSGMRVKILEGMALGKVVISTRLGLEGIDATHQKEVLIADTKEEFVKCIQYCHDHPEALQEIGNNAKAFVKENFCNETIAFNLYNSFKYLISPAYKQKKLEVH